MGSVILVGEEKEAIRAISDTISTHLPAAQIREVKADSLIGALLMEKVSLIVYVISAGREVDLGIVSQIRAATSQTPLLIYGNFQQMRNEALHMLNKGVHGVLSVTSGASRHVKAIDALLRGGTYVDEVVKYQVIVDLLHS